MKVVEPLPPEVISVIIPAYNAESTLGSTLASVLDQSHTALEVLVIDDGSTDDTGAIIARAVAADPRVRAVGDHRNHGRSAARNTGIAEATGDWVAFVDADDLLAPDRFELMLTASRTRTGCRLVTDDRWGFTVAEDDSVAMQHRFPARHTWRTGTDHDLDPARHFTDRFGHLDVLVQRDALRVTGANFPEELAIGEDLAFYLTLLFSEPSLRPVRHARGSYYYRLGPSSREAGAADTMQRVVDLVVARTGSTQLRALADQWQPIHSYLFRRTDQALAAEGRLGQPRTAPDARVQPDSRRGLAWLISVKALQWVGRIVDRPTVGAVRADVERQLSRTV